MGLTFTLSNSQSFAGTSFGSFMSNMNGPDGLFNTLPVLATVVTGSCFPFVASPNIGAAIAAVNQGNGFVQQAELAPAAMIAGDGTAVLEGVSFDSETAILGYTELIGSGAPAIGFGAFAFFRDVFGNWAQQASLPTGNAASGDTFGSSSAISGDWAAVGATQIAAATDGEAFLYYYHYHNGWVLTQTLAPSDLTHGDSFGSAMFMVGDWLFVAAVDQASSKGAVYIFQNQSGTWVQVQKLIGVSAGDQFGYSISSDGVTLAIGATQNSTAGGYVKLYTLVSGVWTLKQTITDPAATVGDDFGNGVSVSGELLVVGTPGDTSDAGAVYAFTNTTGTFLQQQKITQAATRFFGETVAAYSGGDGCQLAVGAELTGGTHSASYFLAAPAIEPPIELSQIAFIGIRRNEGALPSLAQSTCQTFRPSTYTYPLTGQLTSSQAKGYGVSQAPLILRQTINDYDFELHQIIISYSGPAGVTLPAVCTALMLYDASKQATANIPPLDKFWNGAPGSEYFDGAIVPPLLYPQQTQIRVDVFNLLQNSDLPVTVNVHLVGRNRKPC
jgi:hypothetical protein